ncbi:dipeptidyl aminopeptidase/acylaminoacyl peptidase [Mucilaginibacter gracilis]|uniref:Dipeptidyl aminopeptidase/acylaminoacyl peptidase n=1 Tax=Mucilaginibacter gracilis TaxID=423350 RepID=A0A495J0J4_9SPHI|nr:S9 family peptidase [Mucilaginibacter gracilis]RKR82447.1 dipeptidyl aminopeptidase/acylaminoacyl peptidase [Mucilaginibacter gracilis]
MKKISILFSLLFLNLTAITATAQNNQKMTPELLWKLGRYGAGVLTPDGNNIIYTVTTYNLANNKGEPNLFSLPVNGGPSQQITNEAGGKDILRFDEATGRITYWYDGRIWQMNSNGTNLAMLTVDQKDDFENIRISPDGKKIIYTRDVQIQKVLGKDKYADLPKANAYVITDLNYRHWDTWANGKFSHIFLADYDNGKISNEKDIMHGEAFDVPQKPSGGLEDLIFSPDSKNIIYVCKKKSGKDYAQSTNTDLYQYNIATDETRNTTQGMNGYDTQPQFNHSGSHMAWLSMKEDGYEADKNDIVIRNLKTGLKVNLTAAWDESINSFCFSKDDSKIYFIAVHNGTEQLFSVDVKVPSATGQSVTQITKGQWDVTSIIGQSGSKLIVTRTDMNHAAEIYSVDLSTGNMQKLSDINDKINNRLIPSKVDERHIKTTDGKDMLAWVIYPPDFDPTKKYPTLLYCQGGPQSALSQFYSFRWNFQLMAAQGYIVIAPNRRGMPGHGVEWNRQISGDWGGQAIQDYLSAIDDIAKEPFVDKERLGCIGASYGGYSVYMLAGVHNGRFKTFIAHDGLFDLKSWYGTTEEIWFANKDIGGNYWDKSNLKAQKSYLKFNPSNYVDKWNTPIMVVQGGKDYRVPNEQGFQAFQAAQLRGIKSKFLFLPDENHWVLKPQNAILWQREFFDWLKETL